MGFLPPGFELPELLEHDRFRLRPITVHDEAPARPVNLVPVGML